jgi:hypothetical protein
MGRTACTEPQCLYSRAIPLLPLWAVRPVLSLSACTRVNFTFFVAIGTQRTMRMRHIVICDFPRSTIFCHISYKRSRFLGGGGGGAIYWTQNVFFVFFSNLLLKHFILRTTSRNMIKNCMLVSVYSTRCECQISIQLEFSRLFPHKILVYIKLHVNPSSGSQLFHADSQYGTNRRL